MLSSTRFRVACVVTCLILAAVFASSCFVPSANRFRAVATLLEDGKVGEASAKAREVASALTSPADKKELARVLTNGADQVPVSGDALQDERTADVYLPGGRVRSWHSRSLRRASKVV